MLEELIRLLLEGLFEFDEVFLREAGIEGVPPDLV